MLGRWLIVELCAVRAIGTRNAPSSPRCVNLRRAVTRLHRTILILLLLALPIQGVMAASRWLCLASAQQGAAAASPADHMHSAMGHAHDQDSANDIGTDSAVAHGAGGPTSHDASGTCHLCAACCLTGAAPPPPLAFISLPHVDAGFPPVSVPVPRNVAEGPERPPRTI
jgi:hypothetical protein